ncbi:ABC transporter transmembrane domain-containing protein [Lapidilactobacillus bayanensis]|uniref:ABC transporter transmembrane domain-containing protein n=1 Tax=Lapidilactobacillus bayanensis TaxID=2485998 RepID=UPI000F78EF0D|nr:ABC transporter ATP-binding protein [Lapidilactobacillus bayanensis]
MNVKKYLWQEKRLTGITIFFIVVTILCQTLVTVILNRVLDSLIQGKSHQFVFWFSFDVIFSLGYFSWSRWSDYRQSKAVETLNYDLRCDLARGISHFDDQKFHQYSVGQLTSWLNNDIEQIKQKGFVNFFEMIMYGCGVIFPLVTLSMYHWTLTVTTLVFAILMVILPPQIKKLIETGSKKVTEANERFVNQVTNVLSGFDTLLAFKRRGEISQRLNRQSVEVREANLAYARKEVAVDALTYSLSLFGQFAIIGLTSWLVLGHQLSAGSYLATGQLAGIMFTSFSRLASLLVVRKAVTPIFAKYQDLNYETPVAESEFAADAQPQVVLHDFGLTDAKHHQWLQNVSGNYHDHQKIAVSGPSGSGKSTLLRGIAQIISPKQSHGQLEWLPQVPVSQDSTGNNYALYVPQSAYIFNDTIRYNLTLGRDVSDDLLQQVLVRVDLVETIAQLPDGLETVISTSGADLSGGQRQRLALARALLVQAPVLLFDESTVNVDAKTALTIEQTILTDPNEMVFFVSHNQRPELQKYFDQTIDLQIAE